MNPLVSIIILNWNGWQDTLECLESIYQINYPNYHVILVDNHSQDQSLEKIREYCQGKIATESKFYTYNPENKPLTLNELTKKEAEEEISKIEMPDNHLTLIKNDTKLRFCQRKQHSHKIHPKNPTTPTIFSS